MSRQYWAELGSTVVADGTAVANTTTETIIFPNITIPGNFMSDGRAIRMYTAGRYSTTATPTLVFAIRWGGVSGTVLAQSTTITGGSTITNAIWEQEAVLQTRSNGLSGTIFCIGSAKLGSGLTTPAVGSATAAPGISMMGSAASQITPAAVTVDLTNDTALSITADWSAASASNTLTGHIYLLEFLN